MLDPSALLMRFFVELVAAAARRKRLKMGDFAALVWPELAARSARQRWQYMRKGIPGKGRPMELTLVDADKMARILGQDIVVLVMRAKDQVTQAQEEAEAVNKDRTRFKVKQRSL